MNPRIAERRRRVRKGRQHRRLRRSSLVVVAAVIAITAVGIERSPLLGLVEVRVVGTDRLDRASAREAAGLELGTSSLRLDLDAVEARVEQLPLVATAVAQRADPLTVEIVVTERVPELQASDGLTTVLVDAEGIVIRRAAESGVPRVETRTLPKPGERVTQAPALANAQAIYQSLSGPLRALTDRYVAVGPDNLDLVLHDGTRVRVGRAERVDEKVRALGAVLEDLGEESVALIDVRAPNAPVARTH